MPETTLQQTREEIARQEVGQTTVGRGTAWVLVAQFLLVVGAVPLSEILYNNFANNLSRLALAVLPPAGNHDSGPFTSWFVSRNRAIIRELEQFEDAVEDASLFGRSLRPPTQYLLAGLGAGNEQAYIGRTPWLFYRQSLDYLTGPAIQPHVLPAIVHLKEQLDARGIQLIVMPTPDKPSVHPEYFTGRFEGREGPLRPESFAAFVRELEVRGVLLFDAAPLLLEAKRDTGKPQYLTTDTHWRPEAEELVAARLRDFLARHVHLPAAPPAGYVSEPGEVTNLGDIARMLDLPEWQGRYSAERVQLRQIRTADDALWRPSPSADILLLGDSFSNIYSLAEMGWGESAGLAEQLSFLLQRPVDAILQNADGAFATRELLARELASGRDRLAGKRLVIFQFAERELAVGDWKLVELGLGEAAPGRFFVPEAGDEVIVTGIIREIAPIPRPGTVPYADHITALHLVDLSSEREGMSGGEALVYVWGMRHHVLQEAAQFRTGNRITVELRPWADVANQYDGISRTELENEDVQFEEPTWGEVLN